MKKTTALLLGLLLLISSLTSCGARKLEEPVELIIANDIHYISPEINGYTVYDIIGETFYHMPRDGKLVNYIVEITDAFLSEVIERKPKALILAGDLTMDGAVVSHEELVSKLTAVKDAGIDLLIIPGNHDVDSAAVDYSEGTLKETEAVDSAKYIELYEPLMPETVSRDSVSMSYIYQASEKLRVLMLDTNTYGKCYVKDETLKWIEEELIAAEDKGVSVISVSHQNLYAHNELLSFQYELYNSKKLLELYEKYSVKCNFSAHIHIQSILDDKTVPEVSTSSMAITGTHYGEIIYDGTQLNYSAKSVDVASYAASIGSTDENLLNFASYATTHFEETARKQCKSELTGSIFPDGVIDIMAETYSKINSAYFEGKPIDESEYRVGISQWELYTEESFIAKYIMSMLKRSDRDHRQITIKLK